MAYEKQVPFTGDARKALETGRKSFMHRGFQITAIENSSFEARRPWMLRGRQDPIVGVSIATVRVADGIISVRAEQANVWRLIRLLVFVFAAVGIGVTVPLGLALDWRFGLMALPWFALCFILLPLGGLQMCKQGTKALDTLIADMAAVGSEK